MSEPSFSAKILISAKPESVYRAITRKVNKWWTELSNQAEHVGDQLTVRFEKTTTWMMTVIEASPCRSLAWKVEKANHDVVGLKKRDEWKGTTIRWQIAENEMGSKVTITHQGLVPALECYEMCEAGWDYFLGSLKSFLETGQGYPYQKKAVE